MEKWAIPGAGAIIIHKDITGEYLLLQERFKDDAPQERGLLEIPAGKIREFESVFDTLRREVREETGLEITEIVGEDGACIWEASGYQAIHFTPFSCTQNIKGQYPILVLVFLCSAKGDLLHRSNESKNYRWVSKAELGLMLENTPENLYPMHVDTLRQYLRLHI